MKKDFIMGMIYLMLAVGCIVVADKIQTPTFWHDSLLLIGGIFLGGVCAEAVVLKVKQAREMDKQ